MGQLGRLSCLVLVVLISVPVFTFPSQQVLARDRRQWDWSRNNNRPVFGWGPSSRYGWVAGEPRQLQSSGEHPISVRCMEDMMVVSVARDLYRNGKLVKASDLSLGPRLCRPSPESTDSTVIFRYPLQECGSNLQMTPDYLIYSINLTYSPAPSSDSSIIRANSIVVPIQCYYPRHGNVSSDAIKPTWMPFRISVSSEERLPFSLRLMDDDWTAPRTSSVFQLGEVFHIEASVAVGNHVPMRIFVDSCVATLSPEANSSPRYDIIDLYGCLLDGRQEDSSSAFRSPRPRPDTLQFMVDAFRFTETDASVIYITCNLRAAAESQAPDTMNKACSFSKSTNTWSALEGANDICRCCNTDNCAIPFGQTSGLGLKDFRKRAALDSQEHASATLGPLVVIGSGRSRVLSVNSNAGAGPQERASAALGPLVVIGAGDSRVIAGTEDAAPDSQEHALATLWPLVVMGADRSQTPATHEEPERLEWWLLVTVGSISLVAFVVFIIIVGKAISTSRS